MSPRRSRRHPLHLLAAWSVLACTPEASPGVDPGTTGITGTTGTTGEISPTDSIPTTSEDSPSSTGTTSDPTTASSTSSTGSSESTDSPGMCGDAVLDDGEECDQGADNQNDGECTLDCKTAVCGDGLVWSGVEECDDAVDNGNHYDGCSPACTENPRCGDSVLDIQFEDCDYGVNNGTGESNGMNGPCSSGCRWDARTVFLSSLLYTGDLTDGELKGLAGADSLCQARAWAAGMQRWNTFMAWLSDGHTGPLKRFVPIPVRPLVLPNGELVANSFSELVLNGPGEGIRVDEFGMPLPPSLVWTNTGITGEPAREDDHCNGWSTAALGPTASVGLSHMSHESMDEWNLWQMEKQWTSKLEDWMCIEQARLYCFEQ